MIVSPSEIGALDSASRGEFPLRLGGKFFASPSCVSLRVFIRNVHDRVVLDTFDRAFWSKRVTAPEISTLIDYASSYENVEKLQPFPLDRGATVGLFLAIVIPLLPVVLAEIPFVTVVKGLLAAVK